MGPVCVEQNCGIESNICMQMLGCPSRVYQVQRLIIMVMVVGVLPVKRGLFQLNCPLRNSQWAQDRRGLPQNGHQQKNRAETAGHERRFNLTTNTYTEFLGRPDSAPQGSIDEPG